MYVGRHYSIILHEGEAFKTRNENYGFFGGWWGATGQGGRNARTLLFVIIFDGRGMKSR